METDVQKKTLILSVIGVVAVGFLLFLYFFARPSWREYKRLRAVDLANEATQIIDNDIFRFDEAEKIALEAHELWPFDIEVMRLIARIYNARGMDAKAHEFLLKINEMPGVSSDDRVDYIKSSILLTRIETARMMLQQLKKEQPLDDPEHLKLSIRMNNAIADYDRSIRNAVVLLKQDKDYPFEDALFMTEHGLSPLEFDRPISAHIISTLIKRTDILGIRALRYLCAQDAYKGFDPTLLADLLMKHPLAEKKDHLSAKAILCKVGKVHYSEFLSAAMKDLNMDANSDLLLLADYLIQIGQYEDVFKYIPEEKGLKSESLYIARLRAALSGKDWKLLDRMLKRSGNHLTEFTAHLYYTAMYKAMSDDIAANNEWQRVLFAADRNQINYWKAIDFAEKEGWGDLAALALQDYCILPFAQHRAFERLIALQYANRDTIELLRTYNTAVSIYSREPRFLAGFFYLKLLKNEEFKLVLEEAKKLFKNYPESSTIRVSLALAYLKNDDKESALDTVSGTSFNWMDLSDANKLVAALALRENGQDDNAQILIDTINFAELLPEEANLWTSKLR